MLFLFLFVLFPLSLTTTATASTSSLPPVIIVPGTAGSQLQAKLNKPTTKHWYCDKTTKEWYTLWLSVPSLLPPLVNCWVDNILLLFDNTTKQYSNNLGVHTRTPGWGSTDSIEYLDPALKVGDSSYFHDLVQALVAVGLQRNVSVRASPYDFRLAPTSAYDGTWKDLMQKLVEDTFQTNGNKRRVVLLSHSMGCLYTLWFLNQMDDTWKAKYIAAWYPTSGVWAGAGSGVVQMVSGDSSWIPGVHGSTVRQEQRSYESSLILLPTQTVWGKDYPLVTTSQRNYSSHEYGELFAASGDFPLFLERFNLVANLTANLVHPGVNVTHFYGSEVDTATSFVYDTTTQSDAAAFAGGPSHTITTKGDGTVPLKSLTSIESRWRTSSVSGVRPLEIKVYPGQTHGGLLKNTTFIQDVIEKLRDVV